MCLYLIIHFDFTFMDTYMDTYIDAYMHTAHTATRDKRHF